MFNLPKEILEQIQKTIASQKQLAFEGPIFATGCGGCTGSCGSSCTGSCRNSCRNECKGSCKGGCTRSCKGNSR